MSLQKNNLAVRLFTKAMNFSIQLQALPSKITPPAFRLLQIGSAFWQSRALHAVAHLDIAGAIADDLLSADEIAERVSSQPDAIYRLLRLMTALGVFEEPALGFFSNNKLSSFLREDNPRNVRAMILMHNSEEMSRPWYEQLETAVSGGSVPFELVHETDLYSYMGCHPDFDELFAKAMDSVEQLAGDSFAKDFDWSRFERVIDVGGSKGQKAMALLRRHSHLKALVVDRSSVTCDAEHYWVDREDEALLARVTFSRGDLVESIPPATADTDIFLLSAVLHGFDDRTCIRVLRNIAAASAGTRAAIALLEVVLDEFPASLAGTLADIQMFMGTRGRERTLREWLSLFDESDVALEEVVNLRSFAKILVLRPKA